MGVKLFASWVDGEAFGGLWEPLPDADEFFLLSCYVSAPGLARVASVVNDRARVNSKFQARLIFSLTGINEPAVEALITQLASRAADRRLASRVQWFVMDDRTSPLFHPKAHASSKGTKTRLVVGSANLTDAGMAGTEGNYELMTVLDDVPEAYNAFRKALAQLETIRKPSLVTPETAESLKKELRESRRTAAPASRRRPNSMTPKGPFPGLGKGLELPPVSNAVEALDGVRQLWQQGVFLIRFDKPDPLSVNVPLDSFRKAKLLAEGTRESFNASVQIAQGGKSIRVSLLPADVEGKLGEYLDPLGRLIGRYSAPTLGAKWMPRDWIVSFGSEWRRLAGVFSSGEHKGSIDNHLKELPRILAAKDRRARARMEKLLPLRPPREWNEAAYELIEWDKNHSRPKNLSPKVREAVIRAVLEHVRQTVGRKVSPDYVHAQLSALGLSPYQRQVGDLDDKDAIFFIADWVLLAAKPRLKSAKKQLSRAPNQSEVVKRLSTGFRPDIDPAKASAAALAWQRAVIEDKPTCLDEVLVEAWNSFRGWVGFDATNAPWASPPPTVRGREQEDPAAG